MRWMTQSKKLMKKALKKIENSTWYSKNGKRVNGVPSDITGNLTGITGNLTGIRGDLTNIRGDLTGITGDLTGIRGDVADCELTDEDRKRGINITELIEN